MYDKLAMVKPFFTYLKVLNHFVPMQSAWQEHWSQAHQGARQIIKGGGFQFATKM
jgi:hypothetical protein